MARHTHTIRPGREWLDGMKPDGRHPGMQRTTCGIWLTPRDDPDFKFWYYRTDPAEMGKLIDEWLYVICGWHGKTLVGVEKDPTCKRCKRSGGPK